jgi:archaellin
MLSLGTTIISDYVSNLSLREIEILQSKYRKARKIQFERFKLLMTEYFNEAFVTASKTNMFNIIISKDLLYNLKTKEKYLICIDKNIIHITTNNSENHCEVHIDFTGVPSGCIGGECNLYNSIIYNKEIVEHILYLAKNIHPQMKQKYTELYNTKL